MKRAVALGLLLTALGCVYYNGMWSAKRLARDARRFEAGGRGAAAKGAPAPPAAKTRAPAGPPPPRPWADEAPGPPGGGRAARGARLGAGPAPARPRAKERE